jgi:molybdate transport system substrate-binding protein
MTLALWFAAFAVAPHRLVRAADEPGQEIVVFAAASMQESLDAAVEAFREDHADVVVQTSYASSSMLAQQIESGADADLFISASAKWVSVLDDQDLIDRSAPLVGNQLVIVVAAEDGAQVRRTADLATPAVKKLALADPDAVPAGVYAKQALIRLKLWTSVEDKVVSAADVRQALSYVESGAAEAGMVYATDAAVSQKVRVALRLDAKLTEPIVYPVALTRAGARQPAAKALFQFLLSDPAQAIFRQHGFLPPPTAKD